MKTSNILIGAGIIAAAYLYTKRKADITPVAIPVGPNTSGNTGVVSPVLTDLTSIVPLSTPIQNTFSAVTINPVSSLGESASMSGIVVVDRKNAHLVSRVAGYRMPNARRNYPALKGGALM